MKRALLIFLALVLATVGWTAVCADDGFYVIPTMKGKYAPVPKTGQTDDYCVAGSDGDLKKGVAWPTPRFTDNGNGTVTDKLTGLIWLKNAYDVPKNWADALSAAATVANNNHGLTDGSKPGDWRLPNLRELMSLADYGHHNPALPAGHPFQMVQSDYYWSSTTNANGSAVAWIVDFGGGVMNGNDKGTYLYVWYVRGGP